MSSRERTNQREIQLKLIHRFIIRSFCTGSQSPIWWQRLDFDSLIPLRHVRILESFPAICIVHDRIIYVYTRKSGWMILKISFPLVEEDSQQRVWRTSELCWRNSSLRQLILILEENFVFCFPLSFSSFLLPYMLLLDVVQRELSDSRTCLMNKDISSVRFLEIKTKSCANRKRKTQ